VIPESCAVIEPCCSRSYLLCRDVVDAVAEALRECQGLDGCADLEAVVTHHEAIGTGHYVAAWLVAETYTDRLLVPLPTISVRYVEPGFPTPQNVGGVFQRPSWASVEAAASHSYAHGDVIVDALRSGVNTSAPHWRGCRNVRIDRRVPDRQQGVHAGWTVTATWTL
jgi:hypothetical protein